MEIILLLLAIALLLSGPAAYFRGADSRVDERRRF
jgi:hypothetical protein